MSARVTGATLRAATDLNPGRRVTGQVLRPLVEFANIERRATGQSMRLLVKVPPPGGIQGTQSTGQSMRALYNRTPDFRWIEMLKYEIFPNDISFDSVGTTRFATEVVQVDSGHDQRNARWDEPLLEFDISYGVRTMDHLHDLLRFFRRMRGRTFSFLYKDYWDFTSSFANGKDARVPDAITSTDQVIGTGDGVLTSFQLTKEYGEGSDFATRVITKPKGGTTLIALDGTDALNFSVDLLTGIVTFNPRKTSILTGAVLSNVSGDTWRIDAATGDLTFNINERITITGGFTDPLNQITLDDEARITASGATFIEFDAPPAFGVAEGPVDNVQVASHPAPDPGVEITAGYEFFVPVRFDTDRLSNQIEFYGGGSAQGVKLVEVRSYAE